MGDKWKWVTFYVQSFVWHPSKKGRTRANFPGNSASNKSDGSHNREGKHLLMQNLPLYQQLQSICPRQVAYKFFFYWLLMNGNMISMPVQAALSATCSWKLHKGRQRKFSKARLRCIGRDHKEQDIFSKKTKNIQKTATTITTNLSLHGYTDRVKLSLHFFRCVPEHSDSLRFQYSWDQTIEIPPAFTFILCKTGLLYLKSSLSKRPLLKQESHFGGNHKNVQ